MCNNVFQNKKLYGNTFKNVKQTCDCCVSILNHNPEFDFPQIVANGSDVVYDPGPEVRQKNYQPNTLQFPLSKQKQEGERQKVRQLNFKIREYL